MTAKDHNATPAKEKALKRNFFSQIWFPLQLVLWSFALFCLIWIFLELLWLFDY